MKGVGLLLLLFFVPSVNAAWEEYQNDNFNSGKANGIGNLNKILINITDSNDGFNFQPLISDINNDNKNEIIIFSNDTLKIFDNKLNEINKTRVGVLQGQPTIFNIDDDPFKEIIFISNHSMNAYFFAYEYGNITFKQEFNFSIGNGAVGSGVKCTNLGNTKICVFMDNSQYIHIVNLSSKTEQSYNTSSYTDSKEKIPAIADIDNDNNLEAVFWFNFNNNFLEDIAVFDLVNRTLDSAFNKSGIVYDFMVPYSINSNSFELKGHPVLADLNNDKKLEMAVSIFYDDHIPLFESEDWFTELFVFDHNGSLLFRKCEERAFSLAGNCNDGSSINNKWEGTNPFALDSNNDGIDEICLIKDKKLFFDFKNMTINCYNYSGYKLLDAEITPVLDTVKTAAVADMNNDGFMEIMTESNVYALNGSSIFKHDFGLNFAIASDIDGNNGLDLIVSKENLTIVFLDNTSYFYDFSIESDDISFQKNTTKITVKNNGNGFIEDLEVLVLNIDSMQNQTIIAGIRANSNITINSNLTINKKETLLVQLDYNNKIKETDEKNNFAFRKFEGFPFVFASIDLELNSLEEEFIEYIKDSLKSSYFTNNENEASIKIYIGKNNLFNKNKIFFTKNNFDYYYDFGNIYYKNKIGSLPYNGLISAFNNNIITQNNAINNENTIINILIYGNEIDGTIAAVKEFINKESDFININNEDSFFIDDENINAIKIFDFLHNTGNEENYLLDNNAFKNIVRNALRDEMFIEKDYTVNSASGIPLRLRNLKPNASNMYLLYLNSTGMPIELPVVLAHGLFSNLSTWQVLASEISNTGRDTWLIEITGGPGQDCEDCLDYTFYNLTDEFVPALLNGVLTFTNKDKLQYVGFSNGCRAALDSLERNKFDSNKVETFVAVGCPGAFEGNSSFGEALKTLGDDAIQKFRIENRNHITFKNIFEAILPGFSITNSQREKISVNLFYQYYNWSADNSDTEPGGVSLNKFVIIQGDAFNTHDGIVITNDEKRIFNNVDSDSKKYMRNFATHTGLDNSPTTKSIIRKTLNNQELSFIEKTINTINST